MKAAEKPVSGLTKAYPNSRLDVSAIYKDGSAAFDRYNGDKFGVELEAGESVLILVDLGGEDSEGGEIRKTAEESAKSLKAGAAAMGGKAEDYLGKAVTFNVLGREYLCYLFTAQRSDDYRFFTVADSDGICYVRQFGVIAESGERFALDETNSVTVTFDGGGILDVYVEER